MAFHNLEGVQAVQQARDEKTLLENEKLTDLFASQVANLFGRSLDSNVILDARASEQSFAQQPLSPSPPTPEDNDIITIKRP